MRASPCCYCRPWSEALGRAEDRGGNLVNAVELELTQEHGGEPDVVPIAPLEQRARTAAAAAIGRNGGRGAAKEAPKRSQGHVTISSTTLWRTARLTSRGSSPNCRCSHRQRAREAAQS